MKRKGKQMVTAVLSTAMLFTMSSMPVYAEENVEAEIKEIYDVEDVGTSADSPKFAIGKIQLAGGQVGQAYSEMLSVEEGAASSWEIVDGSLPAGLALNEETGEISGTPEEAGSFVLTLKAVSGEDETVFDETELRLEVVETFSNGLKISEARGNIVAPEIMGVALTDENGYTMTCGAGTVAFDPETNTLTLDNATISCTESGQNGIKYQNSDPNFDGFTIKLVGDSTINMTNNMQAILAICNEVTITGEGTLSLNGLNQNITTSGILNIENTTLECTSTGSFNLNVQGELQITKSEVTLNASNSSYGINGLQGTSVDIHVEDSILDINGGYIGIFTYGDIQFENSDVTITDTTDSSINTNKNLTIIGGKSEITSSNLPIYVSADIYLTNADVTVNAGGGNAIYAGKDLEVDGGTLNAATTAWYPAIYTDGEVLIQNNAEVIAEGGNDTIWGVSGVTISDSTVNATTLIDNTAIFSYANVIIKDQSDITAIGIGGGIFGGSGVAISDSAVEVTNKGETGPAIFSNGEDDGDLTIENSMIKVTAPGDFTISEINYLYIQDSWVESFGGEVNHMDHWTTWENMVSFQDNAGTVIGNPSLPNDVEMTADMTLTIPANASLTVPASKTLTNSGTIENIGGIKNDGTISNGGTITNKVTNMNLPDTLTLKTGNTQSFTDYVTYGAITGNAVTGTAPVNNCTWSSDKPEIASVENGIVTAKAAGTAVITVSADNMQDTCTITVQKKSSGGSSSSGSSSGGGTITETTNPDGSTTTTETKPDGTIVEITVEEDGTKVETTTRPDGSKTEVTTEPDGTKTTVDTAKDQTVTTTVEKPDGSKTETKEEPNGTVITTETDKDGNQKETVEKSDGTTTTTYDNVDGTYSVTVADADGNTKSEVTLTEEAILKAAEEKESISLPMPELSLTDDKEKAPVVTVSLPENTEVAVEIPVEDVTAGTVAVLVDKNGTETIIKTTVSTENGILVKLADGDTIKVVENSKEFDDVPESYWGYEAVQFASSHELFAGTGDTVFSPDAPMTRAMVWTVLARLDGINTTGEIWYAAGQQWAMEHGISDGTNPNAEVTREQMAAMLYRYALLKEYDTAEKADLAGYADAASISDYAVEAMAWANAKKVINGVTTTTLEPQMDAARAQVAQMLKSFCENVVK